jgi:alpha-galactosidase
MRRSARRTWLAGLAAGALALFTSLTAAPAPASAATAPLPPGQPQPSYNGLALTPPMGFNDWANYQCDINQQLFTSTADALVAKGLAKLGYKYVNIDDCWMSAARDAQGDLVPDPTLFPNGMKWLGDYLHARGLKFGIYEDAGYETCTGKPGMYGHFQQDADTFAAWGVDYLKLDYCYQPTDQYPGDTPAQVGQIVYTQASQALRATGRPMVFSESTPAYFCCSGEDFNDVMSWIAGEGNLWRFGSDIRDTWSSVMTNYEQDNTPNLASYAGPGHWNDADMLEVGNPGLTDTEQQSQFTLWSEMASPLLISTDVANLSPQALAILSNKDIIAVDQDPLGRQGTIVASGNGYDVLDKPLANGDHAVVLFNKGNTAQTISINASALGLPSSHDYRLDNLVTKQVTDTTGVISASVPRHGTVIYRVRAARPVNAPQVVLNPHSGQFTPGTATTVTVDLSDEGPRSVRDAAISLSAPSGWTVTPARRLVGYVAPGHTASITFSVTEAEPPPGVQAYELDAAAHYLAHGAPPARATGYETVLTDVPYANLAEAFNNVGITNASDPGAGAFDGSRDSYSAEALAAAGVTPGSTVTYNGVNFTWPDVPAGTPDNVSGDASGGGRTIAISGSGTALAFLGANAGPIADTVTVTYSDGSTSQASLGFPNWCCESDTQFGAVPIITATYRDTPTGPANYGIDYHVYYNEIPIDPDKQLVSVTLPANTNIHVFAMGVVAG